jgi:hypothetical protein
MRVLLNALRLFYFYRLWITQGVVRIVWRHLTPAMFEYSADCDLQGRVLNQALHDEEAAADACKAGNQVGTKSDFSHALGAAIQRRVTKYERSGYVLVVLGVLANVGWAVPLLILRRNIAYIP